ncbi:MAG TPA: phage minor head protein [Gemmatimonadaceae bacterium]|nr:phage minor head protein [Gemmatimonadaceae bacterium]
MALPRLTPAQRRALRLLEERAARLTPALRKAFLQSIEAARRAADVSAAIEALQRSDIVAATDAIFGPTAQRQMEDDQAVSMVRAMLRGAELTMRAEVPLRLFVRLDGPTPPLIDAIRWIDDEVVRPDIVKSREGVAAILRSGLEQGQNPHVVARQARELIGLTEHDVSLVMSFESKLRADPGAALQSQLRDRRFDPTVRAAAGLGPVQLTETQIAQQRDAFAARLLSQRAETHARTRTLNALRQGQKVAWLSAAERAGIPASDVVKTWVTTLDGRERPEHHQAHGTTVQIDQKFSVDGGVQVPGENVYNCRCTYTVRLLPSDPVKRILFLNAPERLPLGQREAAIAAALRTP